MKKISTAMEITALEPRVNTYKVKIDVNFYVAVFPSGTKTFQMRAMRNNRETTISLGNYPAISLKEARERYQDLRVPDTMQKFFKQKDANTFRTYAMRFMAKHTVTEKHAKNRLSRFENYIFPHLSNLKLYEIRPSLIQKVVSDIQGRGKIELGHRCLTMIKQVFDFANNNDSGISINFEAIRKFLKKTKVKNFAAATTEPALKKLIKQLRQISASEVVKLNLECGMHWFMRPGELVTLKWQDVRLDEKLIYFTPFKNCDANVVPLNEYTLGLLTRLRMLSDGSGYVFPSPVNAGRHVDANTASTALRRIGAEHTMHGFRATARTLIVEELELKEKHVEKQLSHKTKNPNGTAYDRTKFLKKRIKMMKKWSAYLVKLESEI